MTISWLIPCYNANPNWLRRCVQSIQAQTYTDWNAILVNDGSTDGRTWEQLVNYSELDRRFQCHHITHSGVASALNFGLEFCGDVVCRVDCDDWSEPNRLEIQLQYMKQNGLDLVGSSMFFHTTSHTIVPQDPPTGNLRDLLSKHIMPIWHPTWVFKKSAIKYELDYPHSEDFATLCRVCDKIKAGSCPNYLVHKNQHANRVSSIYRTEQRESAERAIKELL